MEQAVKKEERHIIQDERGLYFYEDMTPEEKIAYIENEIIADLKRRRELLKEAGREFSNKRDIDYDYAYMEKFNPKIKPDMSIKNFQKRTQKYIQDFKDAEKAIIKRLKKECKEEIKEYNAHIEYYKNLKNAPTLFNFTGY